MPPNAANDLLLHHPPSIRVRPGLSKSMHIRRKVLGPDCRDAGERSRSAMPGWGLLDRIHTEPGTCSLAWRIDAGQAASGTTTGAYGANGSGTAWKYSNSPGRGRTCGDAGGR
jgi:hypothetical protein